MPRENIEQARSLLIKVAAEMFRGEGMPPQFLEDWELPKTTPVSVKKRLISKSNDAHRKAFAWGQSLKSVIQYLEREGEVNRDT